MDKDLVSGKERGRDRDVIGGVEGWGWSVEIKGWRFTMAETVTRFDITENIFFLQM